MDKQIPQDKVGAIKQATSKLFDSIIRTLEGWKTDLAKVTSLDEAVLIVKMLKNTIRVLFSVGVLTYRLFR